jgi:hypothetical protein
MKISEVFTGGTFSSLETIQTLIRRDVNNSDYNLIEGIHLGLKRALKFVTGEGETFEGVTKVFPNTIPILHPNPTRFSTRRAFMAKIKKGSQRIRKHLTRNDDFISPTKISLKLS